MEASSLDHPYRTQLHLSRAMYPFLGNAPSDYIEAGIERVMAMLMLMLTRWAFHRQGWILLLLRRRIFSGLKYGCQRNQSDKVNRFSCVAMATDNRDPE
ncbi:hypothetical protein KQX54_019861 [Cotesia glomerata]|uniref:Uncharacterized protein n=1 Tax=Cotesia glomerata TaxID=32391 RepID=A0AAV7I2X4_COTGL|nr:hypothetical protein KQX54_019861 [Cotesia glomerata]